MMIDCHWQLTIYLAWKNYKLSIEKRSSSSLHMKLNLHLFRKLQEVSAHSLHLHEKLPCRR